MELHEWIWELQHCCYVSQSLLCLRAGTMSHTSSVVMSMLSLIVSFLPFPSPHQEPQKAKHDQTRARLLAPAKQNWQLPGSMVADWSETLLKVLSSTGKTWNWLARHINVYGHITEIHPKPDRSRLKGCLTILVLELKPLTSLSILWLRLLWTWAGSLNSNQGMT